MAASITPKSVGASTVEALEDHIDVLRVNLVAEGTSAERVEESEQAVERGRARVRLLVNSVKGDGEARSVPDAQQDVTDLEVTLTVEQARALMR